MSLRRAAILFLALLAVVPVARGDEIDDRLRRAREALSARDVEGAEGVADETVRKFPGDVRPLRFRAGLRVALRRFDEAIADYDALLRLSPDDAGALQQRGSACFRAGHVEQSLKDFDRYLELRPEEKAEHWQRGIALYYAGKFEEGARQFELHRTVNPDDVENAAWHYLCLARVQGVEKAREKLIPIRRDDRVPMMQVHAMYAGKMKPEEVLAAARANNPPERELKQRLLFAHLYIGLFHEAAGETALAKQHVNRAATAFAGDDYMSDVARVHAARMK